MKGFSRGAPAERQKKYGLRMYRIYGRNVCGNYSDVSAAGEKSQSSRRKEGAGNVKQQKGYSERQTDKRGDGKMYKVTSKGWLKHFDFMIIDCICIQTAFILAYWFRNGISSPYRDEQYAKIAVLLVIFNLLVTFFFECHSNILKRGYLQELKAVVRQTFYMLMFLLTYLFVIKEGEAVSRIIILSMSGFYMILTYIARVFWKKMLKARWQYGENGRSMILVTTKERAEALLQNLKQNYYSGIKVTGVALTDGIQMAEIGGVPVVSDITGLPEYIRKKWVDELFISLPKEVEFPEKVFCNCADMGITLHLELNVMQKLAGRKQIVEKIGGYTVLSNCINTATSRQLFCKRMLDILGGLAGCLATLILTAFLGPVIYMKSPGPIFFSQVRVGRNGRQFKMYKFRSMYPDAEKRKADLMKQNDVKDGMMFKMENDPRIIGGEHGKGIGNFIRNTSLDEFPQFWNVLKGDMSLVGTRPPTLDEWEKYDLHHRMRMATKPGLTGMWQVSGRSDITDFEEVVRLDTEYIQNWTLGMDLKILLKTVKVVLTGSGAK